MQNMKGASAQTDQRLIGRYLEIIKAEIVSSEISIVLLVSVAEQTKLTLT